MLQVSMEADGLEGVLKVTGEISNSTFTQYIRLAADSRRIEFETEIDWKEMHRLLKAGFPVNVYAEMVSMRCSSDSWNIRHIVPELMTKIGLKYAITVTVHLLTAHMVQRC